ncbi:glycosyltransferase family 2 protein [Methanobacterium alcaliphilum]|uniref:glycosyltransferase family 2 protein n=1 Tax=Methanobacterium alcaliphilum TaxID=392018 RepID=UPI00200B7B80|nr:glycosyltransferase family 2 protein [Methanobacterium alcaliphilum]MCK9152246.1 glycosyltransferase family 2 protein [Methanobacterium alcaliphilum]
MDLSIIIVNYRTYELTKQTISSIITKEHQFTYDIYLIDNASNDGSFEKLQKDFSKESPGGLIKFIANSQNKGFAHANNLALNQTNASYILLLNSDTIIIGDCLEKCLTEMEKNASIGALGCKVVLEDGTLDKACRRSFPDVDVSFYRMTGLSKLFPNNERFGRYNLTYMDEDKTYEVDSLVGAFMMVRSTAIEQVGLLDETFFMYGEDIDWCYRLKEKGWKIVYYSDAKIVHYKGASSNGKKQKNKLIYEFYRAMYIFYNKHYKNKHSIIITTITYLGIGGMCGLKLFLNIFKR